ncbi:diguanylate cyclase [Colwelliaceae bacterium 6471]
MSEKYRRYVSLLLFTLFALVNTKAVAQSVYEVGGNYFEQAIKGYSIKSADKIIPISSLNDLNFSDPSWQSQVSDNGNVIIKKGDNWISFELFNTDAENISFYISLRNKVFLSDSLLYIDRVGEQVSTSPFSLYNNNILAQKVTLKGHETAKVLVYLKSDKNLNVPLKVLSMQAFIDSHSHSQFATGIAFGGLMFLALVMLFIFFSNAYKSVLLLCGYFLTRALLLSVLLGGHLQYVYVNIPELRGIELPMLVALSSVFLMWFTLALFQIKKINFTLYKLIRTYCWVLLAYVPISLQLDIITNIYLSFIIHTITSLTLVSTGLFLIRKSQRLAILFTVIVTIQLVLGCINFYGASSPNVTMFTNSLVMSSISFWLNGLLISFLVSRQYFYQIKDKQAAQLQALESATVSKNAQQELLTLQQEVQDQLEAHVQERTLELNIALQELESANRELEEKNTLDELSGLYNRRFYDQKILAEYRRSKRNLTPLSLILIDIDHFKQVNDNYGHLVGDHCITWVAQHIKDSLRRSTDIGCRYGGEEFCLILPETDEQGALALAEELRSAIEAQAVNYQEQQLNLTISCGVSTYKQQTEAKPEELFAAADKALYEAKRNGRNQIRQSALAENLISQE